MADESLLNRVIDVINKYDPMGLTPGEYIAPEFLMPWDEYRSEAEEFAELLTTKSTITAAELDAVWRRWFDEPVGAPEEAERFAADLRALVA